MPHACARVMTILLGFFVLVAFPIQLFADDLNITRYPSDALFEMVRSRCVLVETKDCNDNKSLFTALTESNQLCGTGVIIKKDFVITNAHNLKDGAEVLVNGKVARVMGTSKANDLALLSVETRNIPAIKMVSKGHTGQDVFCVGNPGKNRKKVFPGRIVREDAQFIYTNCFVNVDQAMGASGSGLYTKYGTLIGLKKGMAPQAGTDSMLSVSIPTNQIDAFLSECSRTVSTFDWRKR